MKSREDYGKRLKEVFKEVQAESEAKMGEIAGAALSTSADGDELMRTVTKATDKRLIEAAATLKLMGLIIASQAGPDVVESRQLAAYLQAVFTMEGLVASIRLTEEVEAETTPEEMAELVKEMVVEMKDHKDRIKSEYN